MSTRAPTMLTSAILAHPQRELIAAHSVNHQADGVILNPHYDLFDEPRTVRLRVAGVALVLYQTLWTSAPSASRRSRSSWVSVVLRLPPTSPARLRAPAPQASARSSAAPVRPLPDGPLLSSFLAFTIFFGILLTRSVRTCQPSKTRPYVNRRFRGLVCSSSGSLLNIADGAE